MVSLIPLYFCIYLFCHSGLAHALVARDRLLRNKHRHMKSEVDKQASNWKSDDLNLSRRSPGYSKVEYEHLERIRLRHQQLNRPPGLDGISKAMLDHSGRDHKVEDIQREETDMLKAHYGHTIVAFPRSDVEAIRNRIPSRKQGKAPASVEEPKLPGWLVGFHQRYSGPSYLGSNERNHYFRVTDKHQVPHFEDVIKKPQPECKSSESQKIVVEHTTEAAFPHAENAPQSESQHHIAPSPGPSSTHTQSEVRVDHHDTLHEPDRADPPPGYAAVDPHPHPLASGSHAHTQHNDKELKKDGHPTHDMKEKPSVEHEVQSEHQPTVSNPQCGWSPRGIAQRCRAAFRAFRNGHAK